MVIWREFHEAFRRLARRPVHAALSVIVLGVGLGVVLFLFSAVNSIILHPLPYPHPDRLMAIGEPTSNGVGGMDSSEFLALKGHLRSAGHLGAYRIVGGNISRGNDATFHVGGQLTASVLDMLGIKPILGRSFRASDDETASKRVMLLNETYWRRAFHADPDIIGKTVEMDDTWYTVIGVLPAKFQFPVRADMWIPLRMHPGEHLQVQVAARLAPSVQNGALRTEIGSWTERLQRTVGPAQKIKPLAVVPLAFAFSPKDLRQWVWIMFGASILVLLLACTNVANLQLVQTMRRSHELALRSALGSSRMRLMASALVEGWILGFVALLLALVITWFCEQWIKTAWVDVHPGSVPFIHGIDVWVVIFGFAIAFLSTSLASAISAWRVSQSQLQESLRDGSKGSSRGFARVTRAMVVLEISLTVILLVGSGMFVQAMHGLLSQPGVGAKQARHVLTSRISLPPATYKNDAARDEFFTSVTRGLNRSADVISATSSNIVPGISAGNTLTMSSPGQIRPVHGWPRIHVGVTDTHFLGTFGLSLRSGRFFSLADNKDTRPVAVIDATLAKRLWPHENALNHSLVLRPGTPNARTVTVVGIVEPLKLLATVRKPQPLVLIPLHQAPGLLALDGLSLAVRVRSQPMAFLPTLNNIVHGVDAQVALHATHTQAVGMAHARAGLVVLTDAFTALGLVALLLAAAGLYGVLSFSVAQRTQEIGIRRAIGALNMDIVRTVATQLLWQLGLGLAIGMALAVPWSSVLADPGLHTRAGDPLIFGMVFLLVVGMALVAGSVPLLRALRIEPAVALRDE